MKRFATPDEGDSALHARSRLNPEPRCSGKFFPTRVSSKVVLVIAMVLTTLNVGRAQNPDWGKWQNPTDPKSEKPATGAYPGSTTCTHTEDDLVNRHVYWSCRKDDHCAGGYCWWGISDAIYRCPEGKYTHINEWVRYTKVPCGKKDWAQTKYYATLMGETWATGDGPLTDPGSRATPPGGDDELPTPAPGQQVSWGNPLPPDLDQTAKDDPKNPANENKKTTTTETPKTDTPNTGSGTTETPKSEKTTETKPSTDKNDKHPKMHVTKKSSKTHARHETETRQNTETSGGGGISVGIGMGRLGGFGGHHREGKSDE